MFSVRQLNGILDNARRIVGSRANADIYRTREALAGIGNNIRGAVGGAANDFFDSAGRMAAKVAPRNLESYVDSPLNQADYLTVQNLAAVNPQLAQEMAYALKQGRVGFNDVANDYYQAGDLINPGNMKSIGAEEFALVRNARQQALQDVAQGTQQFDPKTQVMLNERARLGERIADEQAYVANQQAALGRFLENYNPDQIVVNDELVRRRSRPSYPVQQDASWMNTPGRSWV